MAATAKHFPAWVRPRSRRNTDAGPVTLDVSLSGLRAKDEAPYPAAIIAGVKLIMAFLAVAITSMWDDLLHYELSHNRPEAPVLE